MKLNILVLKTNLPNLVPVSGLTLTVELTLDGIGDCSLFLAVKGKKYVRYLNSGNIFLVLYCRQS